MKKITKPETRAAVTRAEEVGKADLNENLINRLDLFVFKPDGSRVKQVTFESTDVKGSSPTTDYKHKELTSNELTRSDIDVSLRCRQQQSSPNHQATFLPFLLQ